MSERLSYEDAMTLLSAIDDDGIQRGTIGQCIHALVDEMKHPTAVMEKIASDPSLDERTRHSAILLAISSAQSESAKNAESVLDRIAGSLVDHELIAVATWLREELRNHGFVSLY